MRGNGIQGKQDVKGSGTGDETNGDKIGLDVEKKLKRGLRGGKLGEKA